MDNSKLIHALVGAHQPPAFKGISLSLSAVMAATVIDHALPPHVPLDHEPDHIENRAAYKESVRSSMVVMVSSTASSTNIVSLPLTR